MGQIFSIFIFMGLKTLKRFEMSTKDWEQEQPRPLGGQDIKSWICREATPTGVCFSGAALLNLGEKQTRLGHDRADAGATRERTNEKFSRALRWSPLLCLHKTSTGDISLPWSHIHVCTSTPSLVQIWEGSVGRTAQFEPKTIMKAPY